MSTYDGAYTTRRYSSMAIPTNKEEKVYEVLDSKFIDSHYYHGSWFEYTWELTLKDKDGKIVTKRLDTWSDYQSLNGSTIKYDGTTFNKIS